MMISFHDIPREEMEAMCTPMHCVLPPVPAHKNKTATSTSLAHLPVSTPTRSGAPKGGLYLGSMAAGHDVDLLREHHITHLVQVLKTPWAPQPDLHNAGFACYRIDIEDDMTAALRPHLAEACNYIRTGIEGGENVLVHCQQGVSRSASIVIAYLIRDHHMTYDAAFDFVRTRRQCIRPNSGFVEALREWEIACRSPHLH
ncbi:protein-tyrosine phosphatase-like protein [Mycena pura]|uniref:protein-tyrosine-phosphatase n=1 Tax=Mycena pura TaxID=153505 RepID=A0AAD6VR33_9AGAR|nr:protein-tyrosine phosphatase-like protein [Mycena pura]